MTSILYEINEDTTTTPTTYYPSVVIRADVNENQISEKINNIQPEISEEIILAILLTLGKVVTPKLAEGYFYELDDFWSLSTDFDNNLEYYDEVVRSEDFIVIGYSLKEYDQDVESIATFELYRYTFPTIPFISNTFDYTTNYLDFIQHLKSFYIEGEDFGINSDADTGVWITTPALNNYKQDRISLLTTSLIIITAVLTDEIGPAGSNSVELSVTIRGRYEEGGPLFISDAYRVRKKNTINLTNNKIFLTSTQSDDVAEIISHTFNSNEIFRIICNSDGIYLVDNNNDAGSVFAIDVEGNYSLSSPSGKSAVVNIQNTVNLLNNIDLYNNQLQEVISTDDSFWSFKTNYYIPGTPFTPTITKTSGTVSWDFGNGDQILNNNNPSYSGYTDDSEKTVTIFDIDDISEIEVIDIYNCSVTSRFDDLNFPSNIIQFIAGKNSITGQIPSLSHATDLEILHCYENPLSGNIPNLSSNTKLKQFFAYSCQLTGSIPDLSNNVDLEIFYVFDNDLTGEIGSLRNNTSLTIFACSANQLTGYIPNITNNIALTNFLCDGNNFEGDLPDFSYNINLIYIYCGSNQISGYRGGLDLCVSLKDFFTPKNSYTEEAVSSIIDDLYIIRSSMGANQGTISVAGENSAKPDADAIAKINGTGAYIGDGLIDNGCRVLYSDVLYMKTVNDGTPIFTATIYKTGHPVSWLLEHYGVPVYDLVIQDNNSVSYSNYTTDDEKEITISNIDDYNSITKLVCTNCNLSEMFDTTKTPSLEELYLQGNQTLTGTIPDLSACTGALNMRFDYNNYSDYISGSLLPCTILTILSLYNNQLTQQSVSDIIDDLYINRVSLGSRGFFGLFDGINNSAPDSDAIAKIEGTGSYAGDGLIDNGCTIYYNT